MTPTEILKSGVGKFKERMAKTIFGDVIENEIQKSSKQVISEIAAFGTNEGVFPQIDFEVFNQMFEQTSWVRAVVGVISKAVTARGYSLVPLKANANQKSAEVLSDFFSNCNPNDTLVEILDDVTRDEYVFGNAFLEVVYGANGKPKELWNLDPTSIRVKADEHGMILGYIQAARYATVSSKTGRVEFAPNEVIHFKLGTKGSTLYGLSPLASLILPITVDKYAQIYNRAFFLNGAKIRGAFFMKDATSEQVERNREYLNARAKNPDLAHADLVLEGQVDYKSMGLNQKDMEFLELREFTRNEILAVYGVPPSKVSIIETGNIGGGTGEHQTQTFYEETILPFQIRVAEKITKQVIRQGFGIDDWGFQFNKRSIDDKDQANIFEVYLRNGVFTPDEVRRIVAPRMPEIERATEAKMLSGEIKKARLTPAQTLAQTTPAIVAIENRFVRALEIEFRKIKKSVTAKIPLIARERVAPKVEKLSLPIPKRLVSLGGFVLTEWIFPEAAKQLGDLEVVFESIDEQGLARVINKFSLEAAGKALRLTAQRNDLKDIDDISNELEEFLESNSTRLAGQISLSLQSSLRAALIEGISENESIQELQARIENQLDSVATFQVRDVFDAEGNKIRSSHSRRVPSSTTAEIIARTEANRAYNEGNLDALKQAGVERVQWLLASDACPECVALAETSPGNKLGKTLSVDDASEAIPVHPQCRCVWVTES